MSTVSSKLKSSDGVIFSVLNSDLEHSETLSSMLNLCPGDQGCEDQEEIFLEKIHSEDLSVIIDWLQNTVLPDDLSVSDLFQLIIHVDYLNIPDLLSLCCQKVIDMLMTEKGDGRFNIVAEPACFNDKCGQTCPPKVCSKCKIAKYCSRQCQGSDWSEHKKTCKTIEKERQAMEQETKVLQCMDWDYQNQDMFKTNYGHFWSIHETRDYCRARYNLAKILRELADKKRHKHVYDTACAHYLSLLRLVYRDNMSMRDQLPFVLLKLNRDRDCYHFIKWWMTIGTGGVDDMPVCFDGDWLYLTNEDMYENLDMMIFTGPEHLSFYVALLCIKLRLVAKCKAQIYAVSKIQEAAAKEGMQPLLDVLPTLTNLVFGDSSYSSDLHSETSRQTYYAERLMQIIKLRNSSFFPALLNPRPLLSKPDPQNIAFDTPEETHFILKPSIDILTGIPGAIARITAMVGDDTKYDPKFIVPVMGRPPAQKGIIMWNHLNPKFYPQAKKSQGCRQLNLNNPWLGA